MSLFPLVRLGDGFDLDRLQDLDAEWLFVDDALGRERGAPQRVELLFRIVAAARARIAYAGGVRLMHTAELILGLGCSRVVLDPAEFATERAFSSVVERLGENTIASAADSIGAARAVALGARRLLLTGHAPPAPEDPTPCLWLAPAGWRNPPSGPPVGFEAVVLEEDDYLRNTKT